MKRDKIIKRIQSTIKGMENVYRTILYGSQARGDAREDSDIDLLILVEGDELTIEEEKSITDPLFSIELETGICISPLVMLRKIWENRPFQTPFSLNIEREGIVL